MRMSLKPYFCFKLRNEVLNSFSFSFLIYWFSILLQRSIKYVYYTSAFICILAAEAILTNLLFALLFICTNSVNHLLICNTMLFTLLVSLRWMKLPPVRMAGHERVREVPYMRYGHTAVLLDDTIYLWGGRNDTEGACNVLYAFDVSK